MFTSLLRTTMTRCRRLWYTPWSSPQGGDALAQSSFLRHPHHLWPLPSMTPPLVMVRDCSPHLRIHKRLILPRSLLLLIRPTAVPRQQLDQWPVVAIRTAEHCRAGLHDHDEVAREVKGTGEIRAAACATGKEQYPYSVPPPLCETAAAAALTAPVSYVVPSPIAPYWVTSQRDPSRQRPRPPTGASLPLSPEKGVAGINGCR